MRHLLFHTNLKFQLVVLQLSGSSVHSVTEIPPLISFTVKNFFFGSLQTVQPRYTQKQSVFQTVHSTLGYMTSFSAKRSVVLTNQPIRDPLWNDAGQLTSRRLMCSDKHLATPGPTKNIFSTMKECLTFKYQFR